jgi:hypothetical protein
MISNVTHRNSEAFEIVCIQRHRRPADIRRQRTVMRVLNLLRVIAGEK